MSDFENTAKSGSPCAQVEALYTALALHPERNFGWGTGKDNARQQGYDAAWLEQFPEAIWESAAAAGNPFSLGPIRAGEAVLDLACGAGADMCIAALLVGPHGRVAGVDSTPAMVEKARRHARLAGFANIEVYEGDIACLPLHDASIDVVISNASINLAPDKPAVFREAHRVLRAGGRLQFVDIVREASAQEKAQCCGETSWAGCVAGTLPSDEVVSLLRTAGFRKIEFVGCTDYRTSPSTVGGMFRAVK